MGVKGFAEDKQSFIMGIKNKSSTNFRAKDVSGVQQKDAIQRIYL